MTQPPRPSHQFDTTYADTDLGEVGDRFTVGPAPDGHTLVRGYCPRCHGDTRTTYRHGVPGTGVGTKGPLAADAALLAQERHFCECGHPHPHLPQNAVFVGCGASWHVRSLVTAAPSGTPGGTPSGTP
ncbi:hypothetical protein [Streptomyces flavofungini]|uniref:Uncharacterized protein n=1 Tax=Streptomyces flavofungini TaxID=68200 RepID=A0ABS0X416_9ACTN|nr:hypothetical protein [Streptomyces flavofungini]MBJ3807943.1 hypothetical protein [Streptomyces flavofungini]GHC82575.1 hypothetical protein GCM10010349_66310 [Streptomyces flavofungini]